MAGGNKGGGGEQEPRKTAAGTLGGELDAADASDPYGSEVFSADIAEGVFTAQAQAVYDDVRMHAPEAMAPEHLQLDDVPNLDELPEDFAVRTLIASAAPRRKPASSEAHKVAQQVAPAVAPRRVPIEVKNVAAELKDDRLVMHLAPKSARAAAFRMLRYKLVERGHPRTVAITSAEPRDGKTTCAANLALAMAECGRARVLLVDANLRRPRLAAVLGFLPDHCVLEQLDEHKVTPDKPWKVTAISPWLHVLAADPRTFKRRKVLDTPALEGGIAQLKQVGYDYIVLDGPAVLGHADANVLQDTADGVLFAMWATTSRIKPLRRAMRQLQQDKLKGVAILEV